MGAVVGLAAGWGLLLVLSAWTPDDDSGRTARSSRLRAALTAAGLADVSVGRLLLTCTGCGLVVGVLMLALSGSVAVGSVFGLIAAGAPLAVVLRRARARERERRQAWPDAVDDIASAVRAGMSLPDSLGSLGDRGPLVLRPAFARFSAEHRVTGAFGPSLDLLGAELPDPVGDRVVEALRLARETGGSDLGRLLRTLSSVLREDARTRAELETRQGWTVNAARLAVAAPWATLALLSLRPGSLAAYDSVAGVAVLTVSAATSALAYALMLRLGRLPAERRVTGAADGPAGRRGAAP